ATQWIHLKYIYYSKTSTFLESIQNTFDLRSHSTWIGDNQILDGISFSNENDNYNGIIAMSGGCVRSIPADNSIYKENYFSLFFYEHVQSIFHKKKVANHHDGQVIYEEYLPTIEYLFRHDRGGFWGIECLARMIPILKFLLNQKYFRLIFNYFFQTKILYKIAMLISDKRRESIGILQDIGIPTDRTENIIHWATDKGLNKLWLCPIRSFANDQCLFNVAKSDKDGFIMNVGLYGHIKDLPQSNIDLQKLVKNFQGKVALYAHIYLTKDEFWECYDYDEYLFLRQNFFGFVFMDLWNKVAKITFSKNFLKK
ncbi:unnamed protein product, partial [Adineta ricciae]